MRHSINLFSKTKAALTKLWSLIRTRQSGKRQINRELDKLRRAVLLDCQPKSKETAVYVDIKWRDRLLELANAPVNFDNRSTRAQRKVVA